MLSLGAVHGLIAALAAYALFCFGRHNHFRQSKSKSAGRAWGGVKPASAMIIFGSGGHTTEMLHLVRNLTAAQIFPIYFVTAHSDLTSIGKIKAFNLPYAGLVQWVTIHRSREVKQSLLTSMVTTAFALLQSVRVVLAHKPQLIICNGPGTCVPLCLVAWALRWVSAHFYRPQIVFAESYCRVESLSLSGRILYHFADKFIVQWPQLAHKLEHAQYIGKIC